jgi:hypothetical protein
MSPTFHLAYLARKHSFQALFLVLSMSLKMAFEAVCAIRHVRAYLTFILISRSQMSPFNVPSHTFSGLEAQFAKVALKLIALVMSCQVSLHVTDRLQDFTALLAFELSMPCFGCITGRLVSHMLSAMDIFLVKSLF